MVDAQHISVRALQCAWPQGMNPFLKGRATGWKLSSTGSGQAGRSAGAGSPVDVEATGGAEAASAVEDTPVAECAEEASPVTGPRVAAEELDAGTVSVLGGWSGACCAQDAATATPEASSSTIASQRRRRIGERSIPYGPGGCFVIGVSHRVRGPVSRVVVQRLARLDVPLAFAAGE